MRRYLPLWDYGLSLVLFYISFWLHFALREDPAVFRVLSSFYLWLPFVSLLSPFLYALFGLYSRRSRSRSFVLFRLILSNILLFFIFATALFYLRVFYFPRLIVLLWVAMSFFFSYLLRLPFLERWREGRIFVLYQGEKGAQVFREIHRRDTPLGVVIGGTDIDTLSREELRRYLRRLAGDVGIDCVVLLLDPGEREDLVALLREENIRYDFHSALLFFEERRGQVKLHLADLLDYRRIVKHNAYIPFKYVLDRIVAGILLVLLSPLFGFIALLVFLDSPGPVFYWQKRVGKDGKVFNLCKFRTMIPDAEKETGAVLAQKNDPRVTRVGRILRKTRLDEFPQLWNVLCGEMSLVGPRPERPEFVRQWEKIIPYYDVRLLVKPGITGWAQIRGQYDEGPETVWEKLEYDLYYLRNLSLSLDCEFLVRTFSVMFLGKGAH